MKNRYHTKASYDYDKDLFYAIMNDKTSNALSLIQYHNAGNGFIDSYQGGTSLHIACLKGFDAIVKELLERGANINCVDATGNTALGTPLGYSISSQHKAICQLLLEYGADIHSKDRNGNTYLHNLYHASMVPWLIDNGIDVDTRGKADLTPLQSICNREDTSNSTIETAQALIIHGANINANTGAKGMTPLHYACAHNHNINLVKLFLTYGADVNAKTMDDNADTPVELAQNYDVATLLRAVRDYQIGNRKADNSQEYWLAMTNQLWQEGGVNLIDAGLIHRDKTYAQVAEAVKIKHMFANDLPGSQKIHGISGYGSVQYVNNPFVPLDIKKTLLLNAPEWYHKSPQGELVLDLNLLSRIQNPDGLLNSTLKLIQLDKEKAEVKTNAQNNNTITETKLSKDQKKFINDISANDLAKLAKGNEYSMYVYNIIIDSVYENRKDGLEAFAAFYKPDSKATAEEKMIEYAVGFAKAHSPERSTEVAILFNTFDNQNQDMFNTVKQHHEKFRDLKNLNNHTEYDFLVSNIEYCYDKEQLASVGQLLQVWAEQHKNNTFDPEKQFVHFLREGFNLPAIAKSESGKLGVVTPLYDANNFDAMSANKIMEDLYAFYKKDKVLQQYLVSNPSQYHRIEQDVSIFNGIQQREALLAKRKMEQDQKNTSTRSSPLL